MTRVRLRSYARCSWKPWATSLSVIGLLVTAIFLLTILQRVFSGPLAPKWSGFADLSMTERLRWRFELLCSFELG